MIGGNPDVSSAVVQELDWMFMRLGGVLLELLKNIVFLGSHDTANGFINTSFEENPQKQLKWKIYFTFSMKYITIDL